MPLPEFTGPAELKPEWDDFAARYTNHGRNASQAAGASLLLEYILGEGPTSEFIEKHKDIPFAQLKSAIDDACATQASEGTVAGPKRELNDFIVTKLVQRWIAISEVAGFYPPPERGNVTREVKDRRDALRASQPGGLISSAIQASCVPTVYGATAAVKRTLAQTRADLSSADSLAIPVLENSLFAFHDEKGNLEKNTGRRFKDYVYGRVLSIVTRKLASGNGDISMDQQSGHADERTLHDKIEDERSVDPSAQAEKQDHIAKLMGILEKMRPRDREVIKMRFGINEERRSYTLEEVGRELGLTRERIRQIEAKAMKLLAERAMREIGRDAAPAAPRDADAETVERPRKPSRTREAALPPPPVAAAPPPVVEAKVEETDQRIAHLQQATLNTCFAQPHPVIDSGAMGVQRAYQACTFFKMLREAHGCPDLAELSKRIAADNPGMDAESLRGSITRMRVPEDELGKPPGEKAMTRTYRTILNEGDAEAIARFAYPGKSQEELRGRCKEFLSSRKYWARKLKDTAPRAEAVADESPAVLGFRQTHFNTADAKPLPEVEALVRTARGAFADMKIYDRERAEAIATQLFNGLAAGYSHSRLEALTSGELNGRETHLNGSTLTRWRSGRKTGDTRIPQKVDIDTVMQVADALAHSVIPPEGGALVAEAASYMSALPWVAPKDKRAMLDYVLDNNLDTAAYMLLTRRQLRMQQHEFEKYLHLPHERFSEMIAPPDRKYASRINLGDFEGFIERQGFEDMRDKARFRKMLTRKPQDDFDAQQAALVDFCRANADGAMGRSFLPALCERLQQQHGTRTAEELAEAICHHQQEKAAPAPEQERIFKRDLRKIMHGGDVALPKELLGWVTGFALPGDEFRHLREQVGEQQTRPGTEIGVDGYAANISNGVAAPVGAGKY